MKLLISSLLITLLSACESVTTTGNQFSALDQTDKNHATVYVYAPDTPCPNLGQMSADILVDQRKAMTIDETYFGKLILSPGAHRFHASTDDQLACGGRLSPGLRYPPVEFVARGGATYFLRYSAHPKAHQGRCVATCERHLKAMNKDQAMRELTGLKEVRVAQ